MQIAEHDHLEVASAGRDHMHVAVEEGRAAELELVDRGHAAELAGPTLAQRVPISLRLIEHGQVGVDLLADLRGVGRVVMFEAGEEGVVLGPWCDLDRLFERDLITDDVLVRDHRILLEQGGQLVAELDLFGVHDAVGTDELVDHGEQRPAVGRVEILEHLERAQLELGLDELADIFTVGHGLGEQLLDLSIDLLEHLDVVLVLALDHFEAILGIELFAVPRVDACADDLA